MPVFRYRARDSKGKVSVGQIEAESRTKVASSLMEKGLVPLEIGTKKEPFDLKRLLNFELTPKKVKVDDLIMLCRQMFTMIKAGVPLLDLLDKLESVTRNPMLKKTLGQVADEIAKGKSFAASVQGFPNVFPTVFVSVVDAGERSGALEEAFKRLASYFELEAKMVKKIKSATRYPIMVIAAILVALGVMNFMVIPSFAQMFASFKMELPLVTRILLGSSNFMLAYWPGIFGVAGVAGFGVHRWLKTEKGRYTWDRYKLKMPVIGPILHRATLARFARIFTMTVRSGVPIVEGLKLVSSTVGNAYVAKAILGMQDGITRGDTFAKTAEDAGVFTEIVLQMLSVGEQTGALDTMLEEVADFYEREVDYDLARLSEMIEPILLVVMGALVVVLALGIFLPMWDMTSFVGGGK